jgi:hypothetical protein
MMVALKPVNSSILWSTSSRYNGSWLIALKEKEVSIYYQGQMEKHTLDTAEEYEERPW